VDKPKQKQLGKLLRTNLRMEELRKLNEIASSEGRSRSNLVTNVLRETIRNHEASARG